MLCCHGIRGDKSVDVSVSLRLLLGPLLRCFSYLQGERRKGVTLDGNRLKKQPTTLAWLGLIHRSSASEWVHSISTVVLETEKYSSCSVSMTIEC